MKTVSYLLTPSQMSAVDRAAENSGFPVFHLMERAGLAVATAVLRHYPEAVRYIILCGPGNNGGDGYVAATLLHHDGCVVKIYAIRALPKEGSAAAEARARCPLSPDSLDAYQPQAGDVIIDALFGAGLKHDVENDVSDLMDHVKALKIPIVSVDLPSGIDGRTGEIRKNAFRAEHTVTFMARKPGHLLMPGRDHCGSLEVVDIGIPYRIVSEHSDGMIAENQPDQWAHAIPAVERETHKYKRGHLVVFSGEANKTGAARMAALAGLKAGAGLVTVASKREALEANRAHLTAIMLHAIDTAAELTSWLKDDRLQTFVLGPGFGIGERARKFVQALRDRRLVLDADGITSFQDDPEKLFGFFSTGDSRLVLTPHEGEFARLFPDIARNTTFSKVDKAQAAAKRAHAVVVYKGADTVIASPDGRALINTKAPPWLATAGAGDVLAGIIGAMLARGIPAFEAAAASVYIHGEAGHDAGKGLTAEELAQHLKPF